MKRYLLPLFVFVALLSILVYFSINSQAGDGSPKSTPPSSDEDVEVVEQAVLEEISDQKEHALALLVFEINVVETQISEDKQWAVSFMEMIDPETGEVIPSEPGLAISIRSDRGWDVSLPIDQNWERLIMRAPIDIVPEEVKATYLEMNALFAQAATGAPISGYLLPWEEGKTVYLSRSTAHDADIPSGNAHYSFDFYIPKTMFELYAAKAGTVWRARWDVPNGDASDAGNFIVLQDTSTTPTTYQLYLHLAQDSIPPELRERGAPVSRGQFIGIADDTGASTGHHLHFQVHTYPDSYWGRSVDITFNDVDINGGRPRRSVDEEFCDWTGDVCNEFRSSYVSGNKIKAGDKIPPVGDLFAPQTGLILNTSTVHVEGWAMDTESGLDQAHLIAFYDNSWHDIGESITTSTFEYEWNVCEQNIPDGPVSLALRIWDKNGNAAIGMPGLSHFTKDISCDPIPPACKPSADEVAVFSKTDFWGECRRLGAGDYSDASAFSPVEDNDIQSILVGANVRATIYEDENFGGRAGTFSKNDANLIDNLLENDRASSIKVLKKSEGPEAPKVLSAPVDGSSFPAGSSLSLAWQDAGGGTQFQAQIITPSGSVDSPWLGKPVWKLDNHYLTGGTYLWRARSRNCADAACRSAWSGYSTFSIVASSPAPDPIMPPFSDDVEGGKGSWTTSGMWNRLNNKDRARSGSYSWHYGNASPLNYENGAANTGDLTSPPIKITESNFSLSFWYRYDTETHGTHWDQRWLQISTDGGAYRNVVQLSDDVMLFDDSSHIWLKKQVDLSPYTGKTIRFRFHFETLDPSLNGEFEGWFIDDIKVASDPITACSDSDNSPQNATLIEYGQTKQKVICPSGDVDYFQFAADAGDRISVDITTPTESQPDGLDMILFLIDGDQESIIASHDDEIYAVRLDPHLGYLITRAGTYYLKTRLWAHPTYGGENFSYSLKLVKDQTKPSAVFTNITSGSYLPGDEPFMLSLSADDSESGIAHVQFLFHDSDWQAGWQELGSDWDAADGWSVEFDPTSLGAKKDLAFFAHVYDWAGNWQGVAAWELGIDSFAPESAMGDLADKQDSTAISLKWTGSDNLSGIARFDLQSQAGVGAWLDFPSDPPGDSTQMWFVAQPGKTYGFRMRAIDFAGNAESYPSSAETSTNVPAAATLCASSDAWDSSTTINDNKSSNATMTFTGAPPTTHNFCNPLSSDRANDEDWIKFSVKNGKFYEVQAYPLSAASGAILELYARDGKSLISTVFPLNMGNPTVLLWRADTDGQVFVRIRHLNGGIFGSSIAYDLKVVESGRIFMPVIKR